VKRANYLVLYPVAGETSQDSQEICEVNALSQCYARDLTHAPNCAVWMATNEDLVLATRNGPLHTLREPGLPGNAPTAIIVGQSGQA
jgi:hypothetical protein